jgi:hypothetical protein
MTKEEKKKRRSKKGTVKQREKFFNKIFAEMEQARPSSEFGVRSGFPVKLGID